MFDEKYLLSSKITLSDNTIIILENQAIVVQEHVIGPPILLKCELG